jgi:D-alanyl-D-alanine carboxypeptidase (penicillin-binding protein 5/6)
MQGVDGLKTGFINASGFNLAASAVRDNHRLIAVVLGGNSTAARDAHVEDLLDTGFVVLKRRQLGQNVLFAQLLAEPAPIGAISRPPVEEGSAEQAGVQIVLTNTESASLRAATGAEAKRGVTPEQPSHADGVRADRPGRLIPAKVDKSETAAQRVREARNRRRDDGWTIQVGAYKAKSQAHGQLSALSRKFSSQLGDADGGVESAGHGYYRARFGGLSASDAKSACRALHAHHHECVLVKPDR